MKIELAPPGGGGAGAPVDDVIVVDDDDEVFCDKNDNAEFSVWVGFGPWT